jgi:hypothetical protein
METPETAVANKREVRACNVIRDAKKSHTVALRDDDPSSSSSGEEEEEGIAPATPTKSQQKKKKLLWDKAAMFVAENLLDIYIPILIDAEKTNDYDKVFNLLFRTLSGYGARDARHCE